MRFCWKHCSGDRGTHFGVKGVSRHLYFCVLNRFNAPISFSSEPTFSPLKSLFSLIASFSFKFPAAFRFKRTISL